MSGTVTEKNTAVEETPALINQSPYDKGWLFKIRLSEPKQVDALLDEAGYETYLKNAGHWLVNSLQLHKSFFLFL